MCKVIEDMRREEHEEGMREGMKEGMRTAALRMLKAGKYAFEEIVNISGLPLDEVKKLQAEQSV